MLNRSGATKVYLACGSTDMRKQIDGLAAIVQECFSLDPFSSCLFAFCNKNHDRVKILQWNHNGFWLHLLRLEKGKFQWPKEVNSHTIAVEYRELNWLLDGLSLEQKQAHKKVTASAVI